MTSAQTWTIRDRTLTIGYRPLVMGIVNVTPDSFSDGGNHSTTEAAVAHGLELVRQGADLLDVGGESTRPGATPVSLEEEIRRVVDVVHRLVCQTAVPISIDTSKAEVARLCFDAGAHIVNDVSAGTIDPAMFEVVRAGGGGIVLMHMQGTPATMQLAPHYDDVVAEVAGYLEARLFALAEFGIARERAVLDPGIGFGKTTEHNLALTARLSELQRLGRPVCLGISRKKFLGRLFDRPVERRLAGALALYCHAMSCGAVQIVRVHDVEATRDAVAMMSLLSDWTEGNRSLLPSQ